MFDCMTYDEEPWDVPSVRVSRLEWVTCSERSPEWSKPTVGFFVLDLFLSLLFVGFIFTALHRPFMTIVDELADHEVNAAWPPPLDHPPCTKLCPPPPPTNHPPSTPLRPGQGAAG
eukprot:scaffold154619_cov32-Tisochrysis_lutea.AAC.3